MECGFGRLSKRLLLGLVHRYLVIGFEFLIGWQRQRICVFFINDTHFMQWSLISCYRYYSYHLIITCMLLNVRIVLMHSFHRFFVQLGFPDVFFVVFELCLCIFGVLQMVIFFIELGTMHLLVLTDRFRDACTTYKLVHFSYLNQFKFWKLVD